MGTGCSTGSRFGQENHFLTDSAKMIDGKEDADIHPKREEYSEYDTIELLRALRRISSSLSLQDTTAIIIEEACNLLKCDRATLFMLDDNRKILRVFLAEGRFSGVQLELGTGIAGTVARDGRVINISEAQSHPLFNSRIDVGTGYKTASLLAAPVKDMAGNIIGVLEAVNKKPAGKAAFGVVDEEILQHLADQAGTSLKNAQLYYRNMTLQGQLKGIFTLLRTIQDNLGVNSLIFTITSEAAKLMNAERCSLYFLDKRSFELWTISASVEIRIPINQGLVGHCAQEIDKRSGFNTRNMLCVPIQHAGELIGVLQIINKAEGAFTTEDAQMVETLVALAAPVLAASTLARVPIGRRGHDATSEHVKYIQTDPTRTAQFSAPAAIIEEDEEDIH